MNKFLRPFLVALFSVVIFISCNDDPTSIPSNLIPDEDKVVFNVFDSNEQNSRQSSSYFEKLENLYGGEKRLLGKNEYAKSSILFSWDIYLADSLITYINNNELTVKSAVVTMTPSYSLGNQNEYFDYTVNQLTSEWDYTSLRRDSLKYITRDFSDISSNKNYTDSVVSFDLNPNIVMNWLKYKTDTTYQAVNYGIILSPTENTNRFIGFTSTYSLYDIKQTEITIVIEKASSDLDTIVAYPNNDLHIVERIGSTPQSSNKIYLDGGYALRGKLFIDVSSLPKNIAINKAILELSADSVNTIDGDPASDSLIVLMTADSSANKLTGDSLVSTVLKRDGNKFTGNITWMVQKWINGVENQGLQLLLYDELSSAARIVLYGSKESNSALRPRLTIYYPKRI